MDHIEKINKAMTNSIVKLSKGNIGCLAALMEVMNKFENFSFPIIVSLLLSDLRGSDIYLLYNDECKRDIEMFFNKIMELQDE